MSSTWSPPRNMREFCDKVFAGKTVKTSSVSYQLLEHAFHWVFFYRIFSILFPSGFPGRQHICFVEVGFFPRLSRLGKCCSKAATHKTWKNQRLGHFHVFLQFSFLLALLLHLPERCGPKTETSCDSHLCAWECLHATPLNDDDCDYKLTMCISLSSKESMNSWWIVLSWLKYYWNFNSPASQLRVSCALPLAWERKCPPYSFWDYEAHFLFVSRFKIHMKSLHNLYFHVIKIINFHPKKTKNPLKKPWNSPETIHQKPPVMECPHLLRSCSASKASCFRCRSMASGKQHWSSPFGQIFWVDFWGQFITKHLKITGTHKRDL